MDGTLSNIVSSVEKRGICKEPRYTHRSPRIKRLSRETIREQLARMIHDGRRDGRMNGERKREVTGGETEKCRGEGWVGEGWRGGCDRRKRLPTVYTYIMQMVPIISEVYNRSINLLTGKKGSGKRGTSPAGVVSTLPPPLPFSTTSEASTNVGPHTTIDKCILLAYHLYAWAFVRSSLSLSLSLSLFVLPSAFTQLGYVPYVRTFSA